MTVRHLQTGAEIQISAAFVAIYATELGDLIPLTGTDDVTGFESQDQTGEPSAPSEAQPENRQAVSICFAVDHVDGNHVIDKPAYYDYWRTVQPDFWSGPLIGFKSPDPRRLETATRSVTPNPGDGNLWTFRRIAAGDGFVKGAYASDVRLVNWPMVDHFEEPVIDRTKAECDARIARAAEASQSVFYWLQTEAPRSDGGQVFPGLRLRGDVTGTEHGLAVAP